MKQIQFTEKINAPASKVWFALWDDYHYRKWTAPFCEGSYAETDGFKQGSRVHFLAPGGGGMYSTVTENVPNSKMYFTHIGEMKNFEEQPLDDAAKEWTGARENYTLAEADGVTTLTVDMDIVDSHHDFFAAAFPKGLAVVKQSAEDLYITIAASIAAPIEKVWEYWTNPVHIMKWNTASDDWHTTKATNDLSVGGKFFARMEAKDGSFGFDFEGIYSEVVPLSRIAYALSDGRKVTVDFSSDGTNTKVVESFHPEMENSFEMQRDGWQMILNNFKRYVEAG